MVSRQTGRIAPACVQITRTTSGQQTLSCFPASRHEESPELNDLTARTVDHSPLASAEGSGDRMQKDPKDVQARGQASQHLRELSPDASSQATSRTCECCGGSDETGHWQWAGDANQSPAPQMHDLPLTCQAQDVNSPIGLFMNGGCKQLDDDGVDYDIADMLNNMDAKG